MAWQQTCIVSKSPFCLWAVIPQQVTANYQPCQFPWPLEVGLAADFGLILALRARNQGHHDKVMLCLDFNATAWPRVAGENMSKLLTSCGEAGSPGAFYVTGPHGARSPFPPRAFSEPRRCNFFTSSGGQPFKWCFFFFFRWISSFHKSQSVKFAGTNPILAHQPSCV